MGAITTTTSRVLNSLWSAVVHAIKSIKGSVKGLLKDAWRCPLLGLCLHFVTWRENTSLSHKRSPSGSSTSARVYCTGLYRSTTTSLAHALNKSSGDRGYPGVTEEVSVTGTREPTSVTHLNDTRVEKRQTGVQQRAEQLMNDYGLTNTVRTGSDDTRKTDSNPAKNRTRRPGWVSNHVTIRKTRDISCDCHMI